MQILAFTETKTKGSGELDLEAHVIMYSGVEAQKRGEAEVGCVVSLAFKNRIENWKRIMVVNYKYTEREMKDPKQKINFGINYKSLRRRKEQSNVYARLEC